MLENYLKIAFRNLTRYKFVSFINLFGLTVGLACCMLILTYILHETSYDKFNSKADRIWRVTRSFNSPEGIESLHLSSVAPPFGPLLKNDFPDIQKITRLLPAGPLPVRFDNKIFNEQHIFFADNDLFSIFDIPVLEGDRTHALSDPFSVMMTPVTARKYFGDADPINKIIRVNDMYDLKVTGILPIRISTRTSSFPFLPSTIPPSMAHKAWPPTGATTLSGPICSCRNITPSARWKPNSRHSSTATWPPQPAMARAAHPTN
jgi:putative ABC transport system permease protein